MAQTGRLGIRTAGRPGALKRELLVDGHPFATTSRDVVRALELHDGDDVDPDYITQCLLLEEPAWAHQRGVRLLNHRDRSHTELARRLTEDGYAPQTIETVMERFVQIGAIDDDRFAEALVRTKVRAGWGRTRIRNALTTAGVDEARIACALDLEYPADDLVRAREIAARHTVHDAQGAAKLANKLIRRGFDPAIARTVGFEALDERPAEPDQG